MKYFITLVLVFLSTTSHAQKDSLEIGERYWEDQLYLNVSFNTLTNQPNKIDRNTFSFGISAGYIKDIPLVKSSKIAVGIGLGYGFDSFNYRFEIPKENPTASKINNTIIADNIKIHNIEMPIQFRLRTSTVNTYSFWRIYTGVKLSYNMSNSFSYIDSGSGSDKIISASNLPRYNKFQTGLILSAGYGTFNLYLYYGLTPILKDNKNIIRIGLSFYFL